MSEIVRPLGQFELFRPTQPHDHNRTRDRVERRINADFRPGLLRPRPKTSRRSCRNHNPRKSASCACNKLAVQRRSAETDPTLATTLCSKGQNLWGRQWRGGNGNADMGHFIVEIYVVPGSSLKANQQALPLPSLGGRLAILAWQRAIQLNLNGTFFASQVFGSASNAAMTRGSVRSHSAADLAQLLLAVTGNEQKGAEIGHPGFLPWSPVRLHDATSSSR